MTLPAHDLRVFLDGLGPFLGCNAADLKNPDARIPCDAYGTVLTRAQQERFTPNLALELARVTPLGAWPLVDYLVVTADTEEAGMRQLARYVPDHRRPYQSWKLPSSCTSSPKCAFRSRR